MGQKSSKKQDLYVTDDVTHCNLSEDDIQKYVGRAREYTAVDVIVEKPKADAEANGDAKKRSPTHDNPHSILQLLHTAHRKSYNLAFIVPKVKGSKPTTLNRDSLVIEEKPEEANGEAMNEKPGELTHTVFLWRPKVKSRLKKEFSLKKMDAKKTFLNLMMDIQHKWIFSVKDFALDISKIASGDYVQKLQELISGEALKGGRLLSVMRIEPEVTKKNGVAKGDQQEVSASDNSKPKTEEESSSGELRLRMVFLHRNVDNARQRYIYNVKCVNMNCTEQKIKVKKKQKVKPPRDTNVTWSENWLDLLEEDSHITEVINIGELNKPEQEMDAKKSKKAKKRDFQVMTLSFHEKPVVSDNHDATEDEDDDDVTNEAPKAYDSLVREVWAPIDDSVQQNLEAEAEKLGEFGWELCTVLVTSHVRMKQDGAEFRKCAIFFQRPKQEFVPKSEKDHSTENLIQDGNVTIEETNEPHTELLEGDELPVASPKNKAERFGIAMLPQVNLEQTKLRAAKPSPKKSKPADAMISGITNVQLKKVDREKLKKPEQETEEQKPMLTQVKLRPTEPKASPEKKAPVEKEAPWAGSLERKRAAALKADEKVRSNEVSKEKSEAEMKLEELKEKRAQRQKRISIHKEEEKRKSLQEQAAAGAEAEKIVQASAENAPSDSGDALPPPPADIEPVICPPVAEGDEEKAEVEKNDIDEAAVETSTTKVDETSQTAKDQEATVAEADVPVPEVTPDPINNDVVPPDPVEQSQIESEETVQAESSTVVNRPVVEPTEQPPDKTDPERVEESENLPPPESEVDVPDLPPPEPEVDVPDLPPPEPEVDVPDLPPPEPEVDVPDLPPPEPEVDVPDLPPPEPEVDVPDLPSPPTVVIEHPEADDERESAISALHLPSPPPIDNDVMLLPVLDDVAVSDTTLTESNDSIGSEIKLSEVQDRAEPLCVEPQQPDEPCDDKSAAAELVSDTAKPSEVSDLPPPVPDLPVLEDTDLPLPKPEPAESAAESSSSLDGKDETDQVEQVTNTLADLDQKVECGTGPDGSPDEPEVPPPPTNQESQPAQTPTPPPSPAVADLPPPVVDNTDPSGESGPPEPEVDLPMPSPLLQTESSDSANLPESTDDQLPAVTDLPPPPPPPPEAP